MADDGDEDVVFENEALYEHLQHAGFSDEDLDPQIRGSRFHFDPGMRSQETPLPPETNMSWAFFLQLYASWTTWLGLGHEWQKQRQTLDQEWGERFCEAALQVDALEPEDAEFLQNVSTAQHRGDEQGSRDPSSVRTARYSLERLLSVGVGVMAYTAARLFYPAGAEASINCYDFFVGIFGVLLALPPVIRYILQWKYRHQHHCALSVFKQMLLAAEKWRKTARSSVRLIQEMELVARGFTLVTKVAPVEHLDSGKLLESTRQCPELRQHLVMASRHLMLKMRAATNKIIKQWPLGAEMENMYLCQVALEEYGSIIMLDDPRDIAGATDNFSLTPIKAVLEICNLQLSELIKRTVLMCLVLPPEDAKPSSVVIQSNLPLAHACLEETAATLHASFNLHRCNLLTSDSTGEVKNREKERRKHRLGHVYTAVHSLDLHLQAALRRVREVGDELDGMCSQAEATLTSDLKTSIHADLEKVKADLDACIDCWEESVVHLRGRNSTQPPKGEMPRGGVEVVLPSSGQQKEPIHLFDIGDPIIPDQVFEAYTDGTEVEHSDWGRDDFLTEDEKEKKKCERREALRLLKELKSVIAVRASDWEEREKRARQQMATLSPGGDGEDNAGQGTVTITTSVNKDEEGKPGEGTSLMSLASVISSLGVASQRPGDQTDRTVDDKGAASTLYAASTLHSEALGHRPSNSSEESGDTDQRELARQDCVHTCGVDEEDHSDELVDDLHQDLVNLADPVQHDMFESLSDDDEDILGEGGEYSDEEQFDHVDPDHCSPEEGQEARLARLQEKLAEQSGGGLGICASTIAAMVAARSQNFGLDEAQTFGDSDSGEEGTTEG